MHIYYVPILNRFKKYRDIDRTSPILTHPTSDLHLAPPWGDPIEIFPRSLVKISAKFQRDHPKDGPEIGIRKL